jgi:hypothetical protein
VCTHPFTYLIDVVYGLMGKFLYSLSVLRMTWNVSFGSSSHRDAWQDQGAREGHPGDDAALEGFDDH